MTGKSDRDSFEIELAIESEMGREMQREAANCCSLEDNKSLRLMTSRQKREREPGLGTGHWLNGKCRSKSFYGQANKSLHSRTMMKLLFMQSVARDATCVCSS